MIPFFFLRTAPPPRSTLFPYTTLFRSHVVRPREMVRGTEALDIDDQSIDESTQTGAADRKSTRLNSSHQIISYAVFCLKKKTQRSRMTKPRESMRKKCADSTGDQRGTK